MYPLEMALMALATFLFIGGGIGGAIELGEKRGRPAWSAVCLLGGMAAYGVAQWQIFLWFQDAHVERILALAGHR